ncbi:protein GVQW3 [Trichonephila clavipes]|nr:protein GVQW3 [Trichonephila clavipes]
MQDGAPSLIENPVKKLLKGHFGNTRVISHHFPTACPPRSPDLNPIGHNATKTSAKLQQAYGDSVLSRAQVFRWFKEFSEGRESTEDEPRSGRPSVSKTAENVVRVQDLVRSDLSLTVRMIGEQLKLNYTTVHQILTNELKMRKDLRQNGSEKPSSVNRFLAKSPQGTSFWDTGKHSNGCNRPPEGYSNIRVPPVL